MVFKVPSNIITLSFDDSKFHQGDLYQLLGKSFTERIFEHWKRLPSKVVESSLLEIFKRCSDVAFRDMVL